MAISLLLGRILSLFLVIVGFAMLVNSDEYKLFTKEIKKNRLVLYYGAMFELMVGLFIIIGHNVWVNDWRVIVTLCGWAMIMEGTLVLFLPERSIKLVQIWKNGYIMYTVSFGMVLLGMFLGLMTFAV